MAQEQENIQPLLETFNLQTQGYTDLYKILYMTSSPTDGSKRCVSVIDKMRSVTYTHGEHKNFIMDEEIDLYQVVNPNNVVKVFLHIHVNKD